MSMKVMVYCPRGCNVSQVSADYPYDECAACGTTMTEDESSYSAVHEMIEDIGIARCEKELEIFQALANGTKLRSPNGEYYIKPDQEQLEGKVINLVTGQVVRAYMIIGLKPIYPIQKNLRK